MFCLYYKTHHFAVLIPAFQHVQPRSILLWLPGIGAGGVIPVFPEGPLFPDHDCVRVAGKPRLEIGCQSSNRRGDVKKQCTYVYIYIYTHTYLIIWKYHVRGKFDKKRTITIVNSSVIPALLPLRELFMASIGQNGFPSATTELS